MRSQGNTSPNANRAQFVPMDLMLWIFQLYWINHVNHYSAGNEITFLSFFLMTINWDMVFYWEPAFIWEYRPISSVEVNKISHGDSFTWFETMHRESCVSNRGFRRDGVWRFEQELTPSSNCFSFEPLMN